jgi:hypothetical protein
MPGSWSIRGIVRAMDGAAEASTDGFTAFPRMDQEPGVPRTTECQDRREAQQR